MNLCQYQQFDINNLMKQSDNRERIQLPLRDGHSNLCNISVTTPGSLE